jgi:hypothetical protein
MWGTSRVAESENGIVSNFVLAYDLSIPLNEKGILFLRARPSLNGRKGGMHACMGHRFLYCQNPIP